MKKGVVVIFLLVVLSLHSVLASSLEQELAKTTYYARQYEEGNINYAQLLVFLGDIKENLNEFLSESNTQSLSILLGSPNRQTNWVWVEDKQSEVKLANPIPAWDNLVMYDGLKIMVKLNVFPLLLTTEQPLAYSSEIKIEFKKTSEEINLEEQKIVINNLAQSFNSDTSVINANGLVAQAVSIEKTLQPNADQAPGTCENSLGNILGSEFKLQERGIIMEEAVIWQDPEKHIEAIVRLMECQECEQQIKTTLVLNIKGEEYQSQRELISDQRFQSSEYTPAVIQKNIIEALQKAQEAAEKGDYNEFFSINAEFKALQRTWLNQINYPVQEGEIAKGIEEPAEGFPVSITGNQILSGDSILGESIVGGFSGITSIDSTEIDMNVPVGEIEPTSYPQMEDFYRSLLGNSIEVRAYFFTEYVYQTAVFQDYQDQGEEICNNNLDDNSNELIDCAEAQCSGKKCGEGGMYCIEEVCQLKPEQTKEIITCGNFICEAGEDQTCFQDCIVCPEYSSIECEGEILSGGQDEYGCLLQPVCLEYQTSCQTNEDCNQPRCGVSECVLGGCKLTPGECIKAECEDGEETTQTCETGAKIIDKLCIGGLWQKTDIACEEMTIKTPEIIVSSPALVVEIPTPVEETSGDPTTTLDTPSTTPTSGTVIKNSCSSKSDCGGENYVCSNGECKPISLDLKTTQKTGEISSVADQQVTQSKIYVSEAKANIKTALSKVGESFETASAITGNVITGNPIMTGIARDEIDEIEIETRMPEYQTEGGEENSYGLCALCMASSGATGQAIVSFDGIGSFDQADYLEDRVYSQGDPDSCQRELQDLINERSELKKSMDSADFCGWFFEKHLSNSVENWKDHELGIQEFYETIVRNQKEIAYKMDCLGMKKFDRYDLINLECETEYGHLLIEEDVSETSFPGMGSSVDIIFTNMKLWLFPSPQILKEEMRQAMATERLPASFQNREERERNGGLTISEKDIIRSDSEFMSEIQKVGNLNLIVQFVDDNNELVYNFHAQINSEKLMEINPIPLGQNPTDVDATLRISFEEFYDLVYTIEKNIAGEEIKSSPWEESGGFLQKIKGTYNKFIVSRKIQNFIGSSETNSPQKNEIKSLFQKFLLRIIAEEYDDKERKIAEIEKAVWSWTEQ